MEIIFAEKISTDISFFKKSGNYANIKKKIDELLDSIKKTPYSGIGKPEQLKYNLTGRWSRRINSEHRLIYRVFEDTQTVEILSIKGHYGDK